MVFLLISQDPWNISNHVCIDDVSYMLSISLLVLSDSDWEYLRQLGNTVAEDSHNLGGDR